MTGPLLLDTGGWLNALAERIGVVRVLTIDSDLVAVRFGPKYQLGFELACPLP